MEIIVIAIIIVGIGVFIYIVSENKKYAEHAEYSPDIQTEVIDQPLVEKTESQTNYQQVPIREMVELESLSDENSLKSISTFVLIGGIVSSIVLFFSLAIITVPRDIYSGQPETTFSGSGFAISLGVLISAIASFYFLNVIANISISLKRLISK